jgi:hypothetical protein
MDPHVGEAALGLLADALHGRDSQVTITASGDCMWPLVRDGDVLTVVAAEPASGALVVARASQGVAVCHRSLGWAADGAVRLAADRARSAQDFPQEAVIGVVRCVRRQGRVLDVERWLPRSLGRLQVWVQERLAPPAGSAGRPSDRAGLVARAAHRAVNLLQAAAWLAAGKAVHEPQR